MRGSACTVLGKGVRTSGARNCPGGSCHQQVEFARPAAAAELPAQVVGVQSAAGQQQGHAVLTQTVPCNGHRGARPGELATSELGAHRFVATSRRCTRCGRSRTGAADLIAIYRLSAGDRWTIHAVQMRIAVGQGQASASPDARKAWRPAPGRPCLALGQAAAARRSEPAAGLEVYLAL